LGVSHEDAGLSLLLWGRKQRALLLLLLRLAKKRSLLLLRLAEES